MTPADLAQYNIDNIQSPNYVPNYDSSWSPGTLQINYNKLMDVAQKINTWNTDGLSGTDKVLFGSAINLVINNSKQSLASKLTAYQTAINSLNAHDVIDASQSTVDNAGQPATTQAGSGATNPPPKKTNWLLIGGIAFGVILISTVIIVKRSHKQS